MFLEKDFRAYCPLCNAVTGKPATAVSCAESTNRSLASRANPLSPAMGDFF